MKTQLKKSNTDITCIHTDMSVRQRSNSEPVRLVKNNRPEAIAQRKLQQAANNKGVIQRNPKSAKMLLDLITPKTFATPEIAVQDKIVAELEKQIIKAIEDGKQEEAIIRRDELADGQANNLTSYEIQENIDKKINAISGTWRTEDNSKITFIGAIELKLPTSGKNGLEDWINEAQLIDLKPIHLDKAKGHALPTNKNTFGLIEKAGLEKDVIRNTLATMKEAGQLDYIQESGIINDKSKVLVEVHYYRERDPASTNLHKDTKGQTLFVNLNFVSNQESAGPEFIVNPFSTDAYDKQVSDNLPSVFTQDLQEAKLAVGTPEKFGASKIVPNGVVAFVDEAIHHKTPMLAHRTISSEALTQALLTNHKAEYTKARKAYDARKESGCLGFIYSISCFKPTEPVNASNWYKIFDELANKEAIFDRTKLRTILSSTAIDKILETSAIQLGNFDKASIPESSSRPGFSMPVKRPGQPALRRQMSEDLLDGTAPSPLAGKRTFFRTWVRAVPA